ncbi:MAG: carboxypeptidase-like regulatory domain-containing protein [Bryobacteraceae bacterium]
MIRKSLVVAALLLAVATAMPAWTQNRGDDSGSTRSVQGNVTNAGGEAVNGAIVQLKNTKTLQIRSFVTREQGNYYFHGLSADVDYELRAEYQGATSPSKTLSSFDNRKQAVINLKLSK